jgi:hypothetical protein
MRIDAHKASAFGVSFAIFGWCLSSNAAPAPSSAADRDISALPVSAPAAARHNSVKANIVFTGEVIRNWRFFDVKIYAGDEYNSLSLFTIYTSAEGKR